jgi:hypothetical protein
MKGKVKMKKSISRSLIAAVLAATVAFSQDLKPASATFDVARLETETFRELKNESPVAQPQPQQQQSVAKPEKKGGHKKLWITLAAVGGGAAIAAFAVNKKLANEGGSIVLWR